MTRPDRVGASGQPRLLGRDLELSRLVGMTDGTYVGESLAVVGGPAGIGKSALLDALAAQVPGRRVLRFQGNRALGLVPFGLVAGLIGALLSDALPLAPLHRDVLVRIASGGRAGGVDQGKLRAAVASLMEMVGQEEPLLLLIDDLHEVDPGSTAVLLAGAGRVVPAHAVTVLAVRGRVPEPVPDAIEIELAALDEPDAGRVLDELPEPPTGRRRLELLRTAGGNPLALVELGRRPANTVVLQDPSGGRVALGELLGDVFGASAAGLPDRTRRALLLAAAGETRQQVLHAPEVGIRRDDWDPAEAAGIVTVSAGLVRFCHPLMGLAVYEKAPAADRREAHLVLAAAASTEPGLASWHRAAATTGKDPLLAEDLGKYAEEVLAAGDAMTAASVLERAVALTADARETAIRRLRAAELAGSVGQVAWVADLIADEVTTTPFPDIRIRVAALLGWLHMMDDRPSAALEVLMPVAEQVDLGDPILAILFLGTGALPAYSTGDRHDLERFARACGAVRQLVTGIPPGILWPLSMALPSDEILAEVLHTAPRPVVVDHDSFMGAANLGACCLVLDETSLSIAHLEPPRDLLARGVAFNPALSTFAAVGWAYLDAARLTAAEHNALLSLQLNEYLRVPMVTAVATVQLAIVAILRGGPDEDIVVGRAAAERSGTMAVRSQLRWAEGRAAAAAGDPRRAWTLLRGLYAADGVALHRHVGALAVADLCSAAVEVGEQETARMVLDRLTQSGRWVSRRSRLLLERAAAVLSDDPADGARRLRVIVDDPAAAEWPLERGLSLLDLAGCLHRARSPREERKVLQEAASQLEDVGADAWRATLPGRMRAAGDRSPDVVPRGGLAQLTDQQQAIVRLAAGGLSNAEIAERLFLSTRTVGSHLYRSFPKLGVTHRSQLAAIVEAEESP
ncbi:AAA family ATPase [Nakamurella sp. YIM 132087]|uniref:AAA family ATPase n=1 Tax=Nakamurella alba TaxID=2665158 RepID=A0A7K1FRY6_9ACTN|nr:LuxR family transcriptional regulator [Nakamurella alba]MTD16901.1 AAA family ATPase [Nakamurella alba]